MVDHVATILILHGGVLILVGMLVGLPYGAAIVRKADAGSRDDWRIAHVQNIFVFGAWRALA